MLTSGRSFRFETKICEVETVVHVDTGSSDTFGGLRYLKDNGFTIKKASPIWLRTATNQRILVDTIAEGRMKLGHTQVRLKMRPLPEMIEGVDVLLGMDFLTAHSVVLCANPMSMKLKVGRRLMNVPLLRDASVSPTVAALQEPTFLTAKQVVGG